MPKGPSVKEYPEWAWPACWAFRGTGEQGFSGLQCRDVRSQAKDCRQPLGVESRPLRVSQRLCSERWARWGWGCRNPQAKELPSWKCLRNWVRDLRGPGKRSQVSTEAGLGGDWGLQGSDKRPERTQTVLPRTPPAHAPQRGGLLSLFVHPPALTSAPPLPRPLTPGPPSPSVACPQVPLSLSSLSDLDGAGPDVLQGASNVTAWGTDTLTQAAAERL